MSKSNLPGFSLIEILVSIGIMAVLSAGVMSVIGQGSKETARDGRRRADLETIRGALELYRNDNRTYPNCNPVATSCPVTGMVSIANYLSAFPTDPRGGGRLYFYVPRSQSGGQCDGAGTRCVSFNLCAAGEKVTAGATGCPVNCGGAFACSLITSSL